MSEPPSIRILRGSPSEPEARAVEAAVLSLWRTDAAVADGERNPWVLAARADATGRARDLLRGPGAWRRSGRFGGPETHLQPGRGDAR